VLGRVPSGLFVLTAGQGDNETGLLASWVQQCSFDPPRVSVAVKAGRDVAFLLGEGMPFTLNILGDGQRGLLSHFARGFSGGEPAFVGLDVERPEGEGVVLKDALGCLFCRAAGRFPAGDHDIFLGDVINGLLLAPEGKPYIHVRKSGLRY
jgi:flavin reductase (DIM6/NTAB) family NADH-FMN oxidoreductase RutF